MVSVLASAVSSMIDGDAFRIWTALSGAADVFAFMDSVALVALGADWAILITVALDWRLATLAVGVPYEVLGAIASEGASGVNALCSRSARGISAKIDQSAAVQWISGITRLAVTDLLVVFGGTKRILSARVFYQTGYLAGELIAKLIVRAILIFLAFNRKATDFIVVGVSPKAFLASANRLMFFSGTFRVSTAKHTATSVLTFPLS